MKKTIAARRQRAAEAQRRRRDGKYRRWCKRDGRPPRRQRRKANDALRYDIRKKMAKWSGIWPTDEAVEDRLRTTRSDKPWNGEHRSRSRR